MKHLWLRNLRDILILPFSVTCVIPFLLFDRGENFISDHILVKIFGWLSTAAGLILFAYTVFLFNRIANGTLAPWSRKHTLVVHGPYRYCRNPMITGVLLILVGEALILHATRILAWSVLFFVVNTFYLIVVEEPALMKQFGDRYRQYKNHVPRWIPRIRPYTARSE